VSATEAARTFSDLLNRVQYRGERFIVERGSVAVCEMAPARPVSFLLSDLVNLLRAAPRPDPGYWDELERGAREQPTVDASPWES
jgi:hypothetical protein